MVFFAIVGMTMYREPIREVPKQEGYTVHFPRVLVNGPAQETVTQDGETGTSILSLNQTNITAVGFTFTFTDNYKLSGVSPAGAEITITSPLGEAKSAICRPGDVTSAAFWFRPLCTPPDNTTIAAWNQTDAQKKSRNRYPEMMNGTGDWTVDVKVTREYMTPVHPVVGSITWSVKSRVESFRLEVSEMYK